MPNKKYNRPDTPLAATPEAEFELTPKYDKVKKVQDANEKKGLGYPGLDIKNGVATPKPYEKKFIAANDKRSNSIIVDSKNKIIKTSTSGSQSSRENLRREYVKDSTDTMDRRNRNANYYNVTSGSKKQLSAADKKSLLAQKKAILS
jgi:hypothetical protein